MFYEWTAYNLFPDQIKSQAKRAVFMVVFLSSMIIFDPSYDPSSCPNFKYGEHKRRRCASVGLQFRVIFLSAQFITVGQKHVFVHELGKISKFNLFGFKERTKTIKNNFFLISIN